MAAPFENDQLTEKIIGLAIELKSIERLLPIHEAQVLTYMRLSGITTGLLLNFNTAVLKDGIRRLML